MIRSLNRLDRYVLSEFLKAFLFSLSGLVLMFLMFKILEGMRIETKADPIHLYLHHLYSIPWLTTLLIPAGLMFGVCFTVAQFTVAREMVAIHSSGISFYRAIRPILIVAALITVILFLVKNFVVVPMNRLAVEEMNIIKKDTATIKDVVWQKNLRGKNGYYFLYYFDRPKLRVIGGFNYLEVDEKQHPVRMIQAAQALYNEKEANWKLVDATILKIDSDMRITSIEKQETLIERFPEEVEFFANPPVDPSEMNIFELYTEIRKRERIGISTKQYAVEFHSQLAFPLMSFIIAIVGSLAGGMGSLRSGGPLIRSILLSTLTIFVYELTFRLGLSLGSNGILPPIVAGWGPTAVFAAAAAYLVRKNRK